MNKEFEKYTEELDKRLKYVDDIKNDIDYVGYLVKELNKVNEKTDKLQNALDEIEEILNKPQFEYDNIPTNFEDEILKIKEIIKKVSDENE